MATTISVFARGVRNPDSDTLLRSGSYYKGDILEFVTAAIDVASVADAASVTSVVSDATGVAIGDVCIGVAPLGAAADEVFDGLTVTGMVVDTAKINIVFQNDTGGALDPGSQTYRILVLKCA